MGAVLSVGMGEIKVSGHPSDVIVALGLGSCIGLCLYDQETQVGGMAHVVLPDVGSMAGDSPGKFATSALPALVADMKRAGARMRRVGVTIAGGAQLFSFQGGAVPRLEVGVRNAEAVKRVLREAGMQILAEDLGGKSGRTLSLHVGDGRVMVKTIGAGERELAFLGRAGAAVFCRVA